MSNLEDLLLGAVTTAPEGDPFYARYGLTRNPFPANRTIIPEVLYNQQQAIKRFAESFNGIIGGAPQRRSMAVLAGTGGGKTHFLRHCRWTLQAILDRMQRRLLIVEFQAGSGKLQDIAREVLTSADELCRSLQEPDFLTALVKHLSQNVPAMETLHQDDLRSVLTTLVAASRQGFVPKDRSGVYTFEVLRDVCRRWISGGTLTTTEKKYLGVISRINTASMSVRVLTEALRLARLVGLFEGMFLCLDEIETIFRRGLSPAQYQAFLQDLRYLYDEALKDEAGYSLFLLSASTTNGADVLRGVNYPVYQRLGFEADQKADLVPITGLEDAMNFANEYVKFEQKRFLDKDPSKRRAAYPPLLTEANFETAYQAVLGSGSTTRREAKVNQAPLLDALHKLVEEKRSTSE